MKTKLLAGLAGLAGLTACTVPAIASCSCNNSVNAIEMKLGEVGSAEAYVNSNAVKVVKDTTYTLTGITLPETSVGIDMIAVADGEVLSASYVITECKLFYNGNELTYTLSSGFFAFDVSSVTQKAGDKIEVQVKFENDCEITGVDWDVIAVAFI